MFNDVERGQTGQWRGRPRAWSRMWLRLVHTRTSPSPRPPFASQRSRRRSGFSMQVGIRPRKGSRKHDAGESKRRRRGGAPIQLGGEGGQHQTGSRRQLQNEAAEALMLELSSCDMIGQRRGDGSNTQGSSAHSAQTRTVVRSWSSSGRVPSWVPSGSHRLPFRVA